MPTSANSATTSQSRNVDETGKAGIQAFSFTGWRREICLASTLLWMGLCLSSPARATETFQEMAVFGASFSRSNGRLTNGLIWNEWLASRLNVPAASVTNTNFAAGGNNTEQIMAQVGTYLGNHTPNESTLFAFGLVANDYISGPGDGAISAGNVLDMVSQLADAGGRHFVIPVQTLGSSPNVRSRGEAGFVEFFADVEQHLSAGLMELQEERDIHVYRPDWVEVFGNIGANPEQYGFSDLDSGSGSGASAPHAVLWWDNWHPTTAAHRLLGDAAFDEMGLTVDVPPVTIESSGYEQNFDAFGRRNTINAALPDGWTGTIGAAAYHTITGDNYYRVGVGGAVMNIGDRDDRTLAIGVTDASDNHALQFHGKVGPEDRTSLRIGFDIEAWARATQEELVDLPGEAAFDVIIEKEVDGQYVPLADLGRFTTGEGLENKRTRVDGTLPANHTESQVYIPAELPANTEFRVTWKTPTDRPVAGWTYGLDNISIQLGVFGDLTDDGLVDRMDVDVLANHLWQPADDAIEFDLSGDGMSDLSDLDRLLTLTGTTNGDADFNGRVELDDFLILSSNFTSSPANWSQGDFNADGVVSFPDFLLLSSNFQSAAMQSVNNVPEPEQLPIPLLAGLLLAFVRRRR